MKDEENLKKWDGKIWNGIYKSFDEIKGNSDVFSEQIWIDKCKLQFENNISLHKNKSSEIDELSTYNEYLLPLVCAMLSFDKKISILDFGGGAGTLFLKLMSFLQNNRQISFTVLENKIICKYGKKYFHNYNQIKFIDKFPNSKNKFNIIHAGSSFHYVDQWVEMINDFKNYDPQYLVFSDLPAGDIKTFVTCQNYYGKQIPVRFWNLKEFVQEIEKKGFKLIFKSKLDNGFLEYLKGFKKPFQLKYFSQLLFKRN